MLPKHNFWKIFRTLVTVFITTVLGSGFASVILGQFKAAEKPSNQTIEGRIARVQEEFKYRQERISQKSRVATAKQNYSETEEYSPLTTQATPWWNNWNDAPPSSGTPR